MKLLFSISLGLALANLSSFCQSADSPSHEVEVGSSFPTALAAVAFDQLWEAFDRDYAVFTLCPEVDWNRLRELYRPKALASRSSNEFAGVCSEMLRSLRE